MKKYLSFVMVMVLILASLPLTFVGFAAPTDKGYSYAETLGVTLDKNIYDHDFTLAQAQTPSAMGWAWEWISASGKTPKDNTQQSSGMLNGGWGWNVGANGTQAYIKIGTGDFVAKITLAESATANMGRKIQIRARKDNDFKNIQSISINGCAQSDESELQTYSDGSNFTAKALANAKCSGSPVKQLTLYIYSFNNTTYIVDSNGNLLASAADQRIFTEDKYIYIESWVDGYVLEFEAYGLKQPDIAPTTGGYAYAETLAVTVGDNIFNHDFTETSAQQPLTMGWSAVEGKTAPKTNTQSSGGSLAGGWGWNLGGGANSCDTYIKLGSGNFVIKLSLAECATPGGPVFNVQLRGQESSNWNDIQTINFYAVGSAETNKIVATGDGVWPSKNIDLGFAGSPKTVTVFIYSVDGTTYLVDSNGQLVASSNDLRDFGDKYLYLSTWMDSYVLECEAYKLNKAAVDVPSDKGYSYAKKLDTAFVNNLYDHEFTTTSAQQPLTMGWSAVEGKTAPKTNTQSSGGSLAGGWGWNLGGGANSCDTYINIGSGNFVIKLSLAECTNPGGPVFNVQLRGQENSSWKDIQTISFNAMASGEINKIVATGDGVWPTKNIDLGFTGSPKTVTVFIYSVDGTTYLVNDQGDLVAYSKDLRDFGDKYLYLSAWMDSYVLDFEAYSLTESTSSAPLAGGSASVLNEDAFEVAGKQAMRVYYGYTVNSNGKIEYKGIEYDLVERGILLTASGTAEDLVLEKAGTDDIIIGKKNSEFDKCWAISDNTDGGKNFVYSTYICGFETDMYDTAINCRGYIILKAGEDEIIVYSDNVTSHTINSLAAG